MGYREKCWGTIIPLKERCNYWHGKYKGKLSQEIRNVFHSLYNELHAGAAPEIIHIRNIEKCDMAIAELKSIKKPTLATQKQIEDLRQVKERLMQATQPNTGYTPNCSVERKQEIFNSSAKRQQEQEKETVKASSLLQVKMIPVDPDCRNLTNVWECSKCGGRVHLGTYEREYEYDFCPNCGRKVSE